MRSFTYNEMLTIKQYQSIFLILVVINYGLFNLTESRSHFSQKVIHFYATLHLLVKSIKQGVGLSLRREVLSLFN